MNHLTDHQTDAAMTDPWPFPQPVQFAGEEPCETIAECSTPNVCLSVGTCRGRHVMRPLVRATGELQRANEQIARLQAELDAMREQRNHFERLALRAKNATTAR